MTRRSSSNFRVVSEGVSDRDIVVEWHEAETGKTADRVVDRLMASIEAELSAICLGDAMPTGVEEAVIRVALRGEVVKGLRTHLFRRVIAVREA